MNTRGYWLIGMLALAIGGAQAEEPTSGPATPGATQTAPTMELPDWAPGPVAGERQPVAGRVEAPGIGLAFTLPETWRADDVRWRELALEDAKAISPMAEAAMVVELVGKGEPQRLLTFYRVDLKSWGKDHANNPGSIALTTPDKGMVVVRPPEATRPGRYADLRSVVEDAIGTLVPYYAEYEQQRLRQDIGGEFAGKLAAGDAVALRLAGDGSLKLTIGGKREYTGNWEQRGSQVIGQLVGAGDGVHPALVLYSNGSTLTAMKWDEKLFGAAGILLEKAP